MILGMLLKNYKIYEGIKYIPISIKHKFNAYLGDNGVGKSSILEALDTYFNDSNWIRNKGSSKTDANTPYIVLFHILDKSVFNNIIDKSEYPNKQELKDNIIKISDFLWEFDDSKVGTKAIEAKQLINDLKANMDITLKDTHYLLVCGIGFEHGSNAFFGSFDTYFAKTLFEFEDFDSQKENANTKFRDKFKTFNNLIKQYYSYIYIPVEIGIEKFTKLETDNMQKLIGKNLENEISQEIQENKILDILNNKANQYIETSITQIDNGAYAYQTSEKRSRKLRLNDLIDIVIDEFFSRRQLYCNNIPANKLSSGEKRQALVNIAIGLLKNMDNIENKEIILAIDEPENSLNISKQFNQFEKLIDLSQCNVQILITTHWYGFLPIVTSGMAYFLTKTNNSADEEKINIKFERFDLFNYIERLKKTNVNISFKSINDLTQSIISSIESDESYIWLICEGSSDKIYFEFYFQELINNKNLRILPLGGRSEVLRIYNYLTLPLREMKNNNKAIARKIYCLTDTDEQSDRDFEENADNGIMMAKRLYNDNNSATTNLIRIIDNRTGSITKIEDCLNSKTFCEALQLFDNEQINQILQDNNNKINYEKNSYFCFDLRDSEKEILKNFFNENNGYRKIEFAKKYVEIAKNEENHQEPEFITEIKKWFVKK